MVFYSSHDKGRRGGVFPKNLSFYNFLENIDNLDILSVIKVIKNMEKVSFDTWDDFIKALIPSCFSGLEKEINKDLENFKYFQITILWKTTIDFWNIVWGYIRGGLERIYNQYDYFREKLESLEITFLKSVKIINTNDIDFPKSIFEETLKINTDTNIKFKYSEFHWDVIILWKNQDGFKIEFSNCKLNEFSNTFIQNQDKAFWEYSFLYSFVKDIQLLSPKNFKYIVHREDNENKDRKISLYLNSKWTEKVFIASDIDKVSLWELKIFNNSDENININISNLNIESVELKNWFFVNKFILTNISTDKFDIINSNLWQTTFNWGEINKLYLENATLNDCIFNGVEFPKDYKLEEWELKPKKLKDNYRQLKFIMDKNGNHTEANKFYELEMSYLLKELDKKDTFEWKKLLKLDFYFFEAETLSQKLVLFISRILNGFWNNWILSFFWLFLLWFSASYISSLFNWSKLLPN